MVLAIAFIQPPSGASKTEPPYIKKPDIAEIEPIDPSIVPEPLPQAQLVAVDPPAPKGSCEDAIAEVWPANLQANARLVAQKESGLRPDAVGKVNKNGSVDYGCFQINSKAHPGFFAKGDWRDPYYNAKYALQVYEERGNWTAWYAVQGILW